MKLLFTAESHIGRKRQRNEDMILLNSTLIRNGSGSDNRLLDGSKPCFLAVADGLGGHNAGDVASTEVTQKFAELTAMLPTDLTQGELENRFAEFTYIVHHHLMTLMQNHKPYMGMGSTLVGVLFYGESVYSYNVGDSRLYRFRDGRLTQITVDHSLANAMKNPTIATNILANCFGAGMQDVYCEFNLLKGGVVAGDALLLCSDGLTDMVADSELAQLCKENAQANDFVRLANDNGGRDNISVIVAYVTE